MEFIKVSDALKRLNSALEEISQDGHIKTLLNKYRFLEMNLYVSNDNGESVVEANELQKEIYYDFMNRQISNRIVFGELLSAMQKLQQGIYPFIFNETISFKEKYYWKADDFYGNSLFKKLEIKNGDVVYYSANLNEEDLERLADQALKNKIAELERQLQAKDTDTEELLEDLDPRTLNNFVRLLLAVNEMNTPLTFSGHKTNNKQLKQINEKLEILGYKGLGDNAYTTLIGIISQKKSKGL